MTETRLRLSIVGVVIVAVFAAMFARLWYLQIASGSQYVAAAASNSYRTVPEPPLRGRVLDAKGRVLADDRIANVVTVDRRISDEERDLVVGRLAELLSVPAATIRERLADQRVSPYQPVPVAVDAPIEALTYVSEHASDFPGVKAQPMAVRRYPNGSIGAHVIGYTGEINAEELERAAASERYSLGNDIGKSGIEQTFERTLRGRPGRYEYEVDAAGRVLRTANRVRATPGRDVQLTIDLDIQRAAEQALAEGLASARQQRDVVDKSKFTTLRAPAGSVVVVDTTDGSVVALASNPTFDPNAFTNGIPTTTWRALNDPANHYPLLNRAVSGQYAPGSTFKLISGIAGLRAGLVSATSTIDDQGRYKISDQVFTNDGAEVNGRISLQRAMTVSSDVYFYTIGGSLWPKQRRGEAGGDIIQETARLYGFGRATGIDLPNEAAGRVPDAEWKQRVHDARPDAFPYPDWLPGDNVQLAVGQGDMLATPLQLAMAFQAFVADGRLATPRLVARVLDADGRVVRTLPGVDAGRVPVPARDTLIAGFAGVVGSDEGTALGAFGAYPQQPPAVGGKTGTAQVAGKQNTSLFVGFTPIQNPRYVVAVVAEEAGYGAETAAPIARAVFAALNGLPVAPVTAVPPAGGN
ncbi:MAG: penicillin-binding protein 2 [Actinomycetes bacterium]